MKNILNLMLLIVILFLFSDLIYSQTTITKETINKYVNYWNTGEFIGIKDVLDQNFELIMSPLYEPASGIEALKKEIIETRQKFPDFHINIEELFYNDTTGAGRWLINATSEDGKKINVRGISLFHFVDGKIKDEWVANGDLLWMQQMGYQLVPLGKSK
ncbi:MAG TPA: ester cyclase [Ignavibacteriaceae bacterium]|nr:ester cyclase [Ignavibacteriaceae bacterium]